MMKPLYCAFLYVLLLFYEVGYAQEQKIPAFLNLTLHRVTVGPSFPIPPLPAGTDSFINHSGVHALATFYFLNRKDFSLGLGSGIIGNYGKSMLNININSVQMPFFLSLRMGGRNYLRSDFGIAYTMMAKAEPSTIDLLPKRQLSSSSLQSSPLFRLCIGRSVIKNVMNVEVGYAFNYLGLKDNRFLNPNQFSLGVGLYLE